MHSRDIKIADLVGEHLQTKKKKNGREMIGAGSRKGKGEKLPPSLISIF
jgi:hypothetical protein